METNADNNVFSSVISDIRTYSGNDPLLPWLRGVRRLRESLPAKLLKAKLPRFLQKCAQSFDSDPRYRNDVRYVRIWLQLMDYVDDPRAVLRTMESKGVGMKLSLFYQAYALYYEKRKKYDEADKMYQLGAHNLAGPMDMLQKSYAQFLQRIGCRNNRNIQLKKGTTAKRPVSDVSFNDLSTSCTYRENYGNSCHFDGMSKDSRRDEHTDGKSISLRKECCVGETNCTKDFLNRSSDILFGNKCIMKQDLQQNKVNNNVKSGGQSMLPNDGTIAMNFSGPGNFGKPEAVNACHHGLVEPTVNTREAMDAINHMFQEPLELDFFGKSNRSPSKVDQSSSCNVYVITDEKNAVGIKGIDEGDVKKSNLHRHIQVKTHNPLQEPLSIFIDCEELDKVKDSMNKKENMELIESQPSVDGSPSSPETFVFIKPKDDLSESSSNLNPEKSTKGKFHEDTVICKFVGAAICDEPVMENICHHGLVEPTVNLKKAMDDINNMFGEPIDFFRTTRKKKKDKSAPLGTSRLESFTILPDDEFVYQQVKPSQSHPSCREGESDLFEPTICMKEAMAEINKMFTIPMNF